MLKILHFADAHIDMANYGRHDSNTGLPVRVMDFLSSLDTIIDTAVNEKVDLVLFAGDAFKDRTPAPTFQREWGKRIMRLSNATIPTLLLVGNHDLSPALGRAHALQSYDTLEVPHIRVVEKPQFLQPEDIEGLPIQVIALPWIYRSGLTSHLDIEETRTGDIYQLISQRLIELVDEWIEAADPDLPLVLTAHCSIQGAQFGSERAVMLGADLVLPASMVRDPRLDYSALGHIHKAQDLNKDQQPPAVYPGSIERVDFGEEGDKKFFVIANIEKGNTLVEWRELANIRPFITRKLQIQQQEGIAESIISQLPVPEELEGAVFRLILEYPRDWEALIDEAALREYASKCFEFHLVKRIKTETRVRIPQDKNVGSMGPLELLDIYWRASHADENDKETLNKLAQDIINQASGEEQ